MSPQKSEGGPGPKGKGDFIPGSKREMGDWRK